MQTFLTEEDGEQLFWLPKFCLVSLIPVKEAGMQELQVKSFIEHCEEDEARAYLLDLYNKVRVTHQKLDS